MTYYVISQCDKSVSNGRIFLKFVCEMESVSSYPPLLYPQCMNWHTIRLKKSRLFQREDTTFSDSWTLNASIISLVAQYYF